MRAVHPRTDAMINGAMVGVGLLGIIDNVVAHWLLRLHRAVPGEHALAAEVALVALSALLLGAGLWREARARRGRGAI